MTERLQKIIAGAGLTSRRGAEALVSAGRVTVNGFAAVLGQQADPETDDIRVDGERVALRRDKVYIMLNKPRGYVTTLKDEKGRKTVAELVSGAGRRLFPVGRLDMDSEGLLVMTDDGDAANVLMHPAHGVRKTYLVWVEGADMDAGLAALRRPVELDGRTVRADAVSVVTRDGGRAQLEMTISEGRNRQIRRMCDAAGLRVSRLQRVAEGPLRLGDLPPGRWRLLTGEEVAALKRGAGGDANARGSGNNSHPRY